MKVSASQLPGFRCFFPRGPLAGLWAGFLGDPGNVASFR